MTDLRSQLDRQHAEERARAIRALLACPMLTAEEHPGRFGLVRTHRAELVGWFETYTGWRLVVEPRQGYARLVKTTARPDPSRPARRRRGLRAPFDRRRYALLCMIAAELLAGQVTTIGILADRIAQATAVDPRVAAFDSTRYEDRRAYVDALKLLEHYGVLTATDGSTDAYVSGQDAKVLYRVDPTRLLRLLAAPQAPSRVAGAGLTGPDLTGPDLTGPDLTGSDLTGSDLTGPDLTGPDLTGPDLTGSDLTGSDLTGPVSGSPEPGGPDLGGPGLGGPGLGGPGLGGPGPGGPGPGRGGPGPGRPDLAELVREPRYGAAADPAAEVADDQRNLWLRHSIVRRLLDDPVVYYADLTPAQCGYLRTPTGRRVVRQAVADAGFGLEERAEGLLAVDPDALATDETFPADGSVVGQSALLLLDLLLAGRPGDTATAALTGHLADRMAAVPNWAKTYRSDGGAGQLAREAVDLLVRFGLAAREQDGVRPLPAAGRYAVGAATVLRAGDPTTTLFEVDA